MSETMMPRITETDKKLIDEWLIDIATDPIKAFAFRTGNETRILASMTRQLLKEQNEETKKWIEAYNFEY